MLKTEFAVSRSRARSRTEPREKVFQPVRNSNTARTKKLVQCENLHTQALSRTIRRESSHEDSRSLRKNEQFRTKILNLYRIVRTENTEND